MEWYSDLDSALAVPSIENWGRVIRIGDRILHSGNQENMRMFVVKVSNRLNTWPTELSRRTPEGWPPSWRTKLGNIVRETQTYGAFILGICSHPYLLNPDGSQSVYLVRRNVGLSTSLSGHLKSEGVEGEADLEGGLSIQMRLGFVDVRLEVEVKSAGAALSKAQKLRQFAVRRRGGIYIVAQTIESAVESILGERARIVAILASGV